MKPILQSEGNVLMDEGLKGSVTLRKFRAPGRFHSYKKTGFAGSIVITGIRFAAFTYSRPIINIPVKDERLKLLDFSIPKEDIFCVKFDANTFHDNWQGSVECRFSTPMAGIFIEKLQINFA